MVKLFRRRGGYTLPSVPEASATVSPPEARYSPTEEPAEPPEPASKYTRRKSVFAEQYDPAADEEDDQEREVYPKTDEQRERLGNTVKKILLFRALDKEQIQEVIDAMFLKEVEDGDVIIRQGDDGDYFYVIEDGVYDIYVKNDGEPEKRVGSYMNTGSFGELALMYNMPRAATIKAASHGSLWVMDRQTFRKIVLKSAFKKRKEYEKLLENVPMLKHLKHYERMNLCDALMPMSFEPNQIIIRQGDEAEGMYFVEEGTVRVTMHSETDSNEVEMSRLTKGEYFGELALVTHRPRAASVYAVDHVKLASLDVQAFERLLGPCMDIMKRNIDDYEKQVAEMFGARIDMDELR